MPIDAGKLNTFVQLQSRSEVTDDWGAPSMVWTALGSFYASIKNETGMGAIRSSVTSGIPASISKYSIEVRSDVIRYFGINTEHRLIARLPYSSGDTVFSVLGVISDFSDTSHAYIIAEVGGNAG